jgi:hypothetical protein
MVAFGTLPEPLDDRIVQATYQDLTHKCLQWLDGRDDIKMLSSSVEIVEPKKTMRNFRRAGTTLEETIGQGG